MFIMLTIFCSEFVVLESLHYYWFEAKVPGIIIFFQHTEKASGPNV